MGHGMGQGAEEAGSRDYQSGSPPGRGWGWVKCSAERSAGSMGHRAILILRSHNNNQMVILFFNRFREFFKLAFSPGISYLCVTFILYEELIYL